MRAPQVVMLSLWRNDSDRHLEERVAHLLSKTYDNLRYVWVVGDSEDDTEERLNHLLAHRYPWSARRVTLLRHDTGIVGDDPETRLRRLSATGNAWWPWVLPSDTHCLLHESDLVSQQNIVQELLATGKCPVAGWPTLGPEPGAIFYDTWAYRKDGEMFNNHPPYHPCYRPNELFEVDSAGSMLLFHADDIRMGLRFQRYAVLDLCRGLKERGRSIWVDPSLRIVQPWETFVSRRHARVEVKDEVKVEVKVEVEEVRRGDNF